MTATSHRPPDVHATAVVGSARRPAALSRFAHVMAWLSLLGNMGIVVTGGVVRLTASGLGCPEWPLCTPESLTTTPEMGWHGIIEFGNRTLTGVLGFIALLTVASLVRHRRTHRQVLWLSLGLLLGVLFQALLGGITVWTGLNPWIVGMHFIVSAVMIAAAAMLLLRVAAERRGGAGTPVADGQTSACTRVVAWVALLATTAVVVMGTIVTGTGPHSGDPESVRHSFNAETVTRLHALPAYVLLASAIVLVVLTRRTPGASAAQRTAPVGLLTVVACQAVIGYWQHFTALPVGLVIVHLIGSVIVIMAAVVTWQRQVSPYRAPLGEHAEASAGR